MTNIEQHNIMDLIVLQDKINKNPKTMTLKGVAEDEGALEGIIETIKDKGASGFKGGLRHVTKK
jgi:hypothetical protein